eukprot:160689-Prorocentrum_minimum.AAC.1
MADKYAALLASNSHQAPLDPPPTPLGALSGAGGAVPDVPLGAPLRPPLTPLGALSSAGETGPGGDRAGGGAVPDVPLGARPLPHQLAHAGRPVCALPRPLPDGHGALHARAQGARFSSRPAPAGPTINE